MNIGILQTGLAPTEILNSLGDYHLMFQKMLAGHGFDFTTWHVVQGDFPDNAQAADGWLITGSKHGAYEDLPWIPPLEDLIREIAANGQPLVGVCFGHQIIAQALGGRVEKVARGWSVGAQDYDIEGETLTVNAWHQDQVVDLPENAKVFASSAFCPNAGLKIGDNVWTIQPHPEYGSDMMQALIDYRGAGIVPDDLLDDATSKLDQDTDRMKIAQDIAAFLKTKATT